MNTWRFLDTGAMSRLSQHGHRSGYPGAACQRQVAADFAFLPMDPTRRIPGLLPEEPQFGYGGLPAPGYRGRQAAQRRPGGAAPGGSHLRGHRRYRRWHTFCGHRGLPPDLRRPAARLPSAGDRCRHGPRGHQTAPNGYLLSAGHPGFHCVSGEEVRGKRPDLARLLHAAARLHHFSAAD